jgi:hypothetical protein
MDDIVKLVPAEDVRAALPLLGHLRKTLDENR